MLSSYGLYLLANVMAKENLLLRIRLSLMASLSKCHAFLYRLQYFGSLGTIMQPVQELKNGAVAAALSVACNFAFIHQRGYPVRSLSQALSSWRMGA